jgi:hypothetical protein
VEVLFNLIVQGHGKWLACDEFDDDARSSATNSWHSPVSGASVDLNQAFWVCIAILIIGVFFE